MGTADEKAGCVSSTALLLGCSDLQRQPREGQGTRLHGQVLPGQAEERARLRGRTC